MAFVPQKLSQVRARFWKGVVYGPPGCGKTVFSTSSRKMRTFMFDVDVGADAADAYLTSHGLDKEKVTVAKVTTMAEFYEAYDWFSRNMSAFDLVVVDTATELQRLVIREVCQKTGHQTPDQRDWGSVQTMMENITVKFRAMDIHVVFCAHEMSKSDAEGSPQLTRPSFQGAYKTEYARHFSFIGRYMLFHKAAAEQGKPTTVVRALYFAPDPNCHSKDRSAKLLPWESPDIDAIFAKLAASTVVIVNDEQATAAPAAA